MSNELIHAEWKTRDVVSSAGDVVGNAEAAQYLFQRGDFGAAAEILTLVIEQAEQTGMRAERARQQLRSMATNAKVQAEGGALSARSPGTTGYAATHDSRRRKQK